MNSETEDIESENLKRLLEEYSDDENIYELEPFKEPSNNHNVVDKKLTELIEHQLKNSLTTRCTIGIAKMMNRVPGSEVFIPETRAKIKCGVKTDIKHEYFVMCVCVIIL